MLHECLKKYWKVWGGCAKMSVRTNYAAPFITGVF